MKLQRHGARADYGGGTYPVEDDDGEYYLAADVDALLASIRAAVDAEREAAEYLADFLSDAGNVGIPQHLEPGRHRPDLDALLSGEGA